MSWSHRKRFFTAVELEEPDVVPITDLGIDPPVVEKVTGIKTPGLSIQAFSTGRVDAWETNLKKVMATVEAYKRLDFDAVVVHDYSLCHRGYVPKALDENTFIDEWGRVMMNRSDTNTTWWVDGTIESPEDLGRYDPPDPDASGRMEILEAVVKEMGEELVVIGMGHTCFMFSWEVRGGIDKLIIDLYRNPRFARKLMTKVADTCLKWAKMMMDAGIDLLLLGDDYADNHGPLISPKLFREFELPHLKRVVNEAKRRGIPVMKHTDGNIYLILDDIVNTGIVGLHPMEPGAMDIGDVKERYGDRIFVGGNVDCRHVLPYGSEEDVRRDVRRVINDASPGGGHILTSSNSLHANVKAENVFTMVKETRKYGKYPPFRIGVTKHKPSKDLNIFTPY